MITKQLPAEARMESKCSASMGPRGSSPASALLAESKGRKMPLGKPVIWGVSVHMGFTQGVLAALIADVAPAELRGTAFGTFNLVTGLALLVASVIAGALWDALGSQGTFLAGAAFTVLTLVGLLPVRSRLRSSSLAART